MGNVYCCLETRLLFFTLLVLCLCLSLTLVATFHSSGFATADVGRRSWRLHSLVYGMLMTLFSSSLYDGRVEVAASVLQVNNNEDFTPTVADEASSTLFSPQWMQEFSRGNQGCEKGLTAYFWRTSGWGCNMNREPHHLKPHVTSYKRDDICRTCFFIDRCRDTR